VVVWNGLIWLRTSFKLRFVVNSAVNLGDAGFLDSLRCCWLLKKFIFCLCLLFFTVSSLPRLTVLGSRTLCCRLHSVVDRC
jgi:hypothetical protein